MTTVATDLKWYQDSYALSTRMLDVLTNNTQLLHDAYKQVAESVMDFSRSESPTAAKLNFQDELRPYLEQIDQNIREFQEGVGEVLNDPKLGDSWPHSQEPVWAFLDEPLMEQRRSVYRGQPILPYGLSKQDVEMPPQIARALIAGLGEQLATHPELTPQDVMPLAVQAAIRNLKPGEGVTAANNAKQHRATLEF